MMINEMEKHLKRILCLALFLLVVIALPTVSWADTAETADEGISVDAGAATDAKSEDDESSDRLVDDGLLGEMAEQFGDDASALDSKGVESEDQSTDELQEDQLDAQASSIVLTPSNPYELNQALNSGESLTASFTITENCYVAIKIDAGSNSSGTATLTKVDTATKVDEWNILSDTTYKGLLPLHPASYELTITSSNNPTVITAVEYQQVVPTEPLTNLEEEPNNDRASANPLAFGETIVGTLCKGTTTKLYEYFGSDYDYYSFTLTEPKKLSVTMGTNNTSSCFGFYLMNSAGKTVVHSEKGDYAIWGTSILAGNVVDFTSAKTIDCGTLGAGTYCLEVVGDCSSQPATFAKNRYQFKATLSEPSSSGGGTSGGTSTTGVDISCALLRADNTVWTCTSNGKPISMMGNDGLALVQTLLIEADVQSVPRSMTYYMYAKASYSSASCSTLFKNLRFVKFCTDDSGKNACTSIGKGAFSYCTALTNVIGLEKSNLLSIGESAFSGCSSLRSLSLPETLCTIGERAFYNDVLLSNVYGMESTSLILIDDYAFCQCSSIRSISVPETLGTIKQDVFYGCVLLERVEGLDSCNLSSVGSSAFMNCSSLTELVFPKSIGSLYNDVFSGCSSLKTLVLPSSAVPYTSYLDGESCFKGSLFSVSYDNDAWIYVPYKLLKAYKDQGRDCAWTQHLAAITQPVDDANITVSNQTYSGNAIKPTIQVQLNGATLKSRQDYTVSYSNNVNVGTATVTVTGIREYSGKCTATFEIGKATPVISASNLAVAKGKTANVNASTIKGAGPFSYKSSDEAVATVSPTGVITGMGLGQANITITSAASSNCEEATKTITVTVKYANTLKAKAKKATVKVSQSNLKSKSLVIASNISKKSAKGKVTYANTSSKSVAKRFKINAKTGKVTVRKGTKKGTYTIKVKVTAAGDATHLSGTVIVKYKVKVK